MRPDIPPYRRAIAWAYLKYGPAALEKQLRELEQVEAPSASDTSAPCGALPPTGEWGQTAGCLPSSCTTGRS